LTLLINNNMSYANNYKHYNTMFNRYYPACVKVNDESIDDYKEKINKYNQIKNIWFNQLNNNEE
jgi:hypothetical protein